MKITPSYLRTRTTGQKNALLEDDDFLTSCMVSDLDPFEVLQVNPNRSRTDLCRHPIVLDRTDTATGETEERLTPCKSANALKCPSCAEFEARLRQRQILNGLQRSTWVALHTGTAPSFGPVHRASWTLKNEYQASKMHFSKRDAYRLTVLKKNGKCPCGASHTYIDEVIGTPLDPSSYDYAGEVIWSENLPALTRSLNKKIRAIAQGLGIAREDLATFAVYERQKRASLHQHTLITVQGSKEVFDLLVEEIKNNWHHHNPTAQIAQNKVDFYHSGLAQERWNQFGKLIPQKTFNPTVSIPMVRWKRGELRPGTQFGSVYDIRPLKPVRNEADENLSGYEQAGGYLAKYLTKNQSALSLEAIAETSPALKKHYQGIRQATLALTADRVIAEGLLSPHLARKKILEKILAGVSVGSSFVATEGELASVADIKAELSEVNEAVTHYKNGVENIRASPLVDELFPKGFARAVGTKQLTQHTIPDVALAGRGLAIRLNKTLNNGGFTGSLTSVSNWVTTMTDLRTEMKEFVRKGQPKDENEYIWSLNIEEMRKHALDRAKPESYSIRQSMDADIANRKFERLKKLHEDQIIRDAINKVFFSKPPTAKREDQPRPNQTFLPLD